MSNQVILIYKNSAMMQVVPHLFSLYFQAFSVTGAISDIFEIKENIRTVNCILNL